MDSRINVLQNHIESCLEKTNKYESNITDDIMKIDGMTGKKTRHFYNNMCNMNDARYLEIGTWKGSSICSAMCNNKITCVAIDNWCEFGGPKDIFLTNFNKFKGNCDATFIEQDCWNIDASKIGKFNIYMYDGNHTEKSHYQALNHYLQCLDNEFIYLVDDWNLYRIRDGTTKSIKDNNLTIKYKKEIITSFKGNHARPNGINSDWHNGICIFILQKN